MKNSFEQLIKWISKFSKFNLKIKYRKKYETVMSNVIFLNAMMREIDQQE